MSLLSYKSAIYAVKDKIDEINNIDEEPVDSELQNNPESKEDNGPAPGMVRIMLDDTNVTPADYKHATKKMLDIMEVELIVSGETGELVVLYDKPLPAILNRMEYDSSFNELYFIFNNGQVFVLGAKIHETLHEHLINGTMCLLFHMKDQKDIVDYSAVTLTIRENIINKEEE